MVIEGQAREKKMFKSLVDELVEAAFGPLPDQRIRMSMKSNSRDTSMDTEQKRIDAKIKAELEATRRSKKGR